MPVKLAKEVARPILACGGDLKNVFCLAKGENAFLGPHIGDLVTEIRRSLDYYQTRSRSAVVNQILLAGGLARLKNLDRTVAAELGLTTAVASPFVNVKVNPQAFPPDRLEALGPTMAVAVGLAMRGGDAS